MYHLFEYKQCYTRTCKREIYNEYLIETIDNLNFSTTINCITSYATSSET